MIVATEKLMSKLPKLTLRMENTEAKKKLIKAKHFRSSFQRAPCLTVHLALPSLPLIPYVTLTVDQRHSSGLFGKEYTVYKIATTMKITLLTHNKRDSDNQNDQTITFIQFRRYSDFVTLHSNLQKKFPRLVLPPLPPKLSAKSTAPTSEKKQNESRRRWLCLWLQYVLLHGNFQKCDLLKEFVIPGEKSTEVTQFSNLWETGTFAETSIPLDFDEDEVPNRHSSVDSKTGIPPPPSIVDVINDAALFKSTQETHTVLRYSQF